MAVEVHHVPAHRRIVLIGALPFHALSPSVDAAAVLVEIDDRLAGARKNFFVGVAFADGLEYRGGCSTGRPPVPPHLYLYAMAEENDRGEKRQKIKPEAGLRKEN